MDFYWWLFISCASLPAAASMTTTLVDTTAKISDDGNFSLTTTETDSNSMNVNVSNVEKIMCNSSDSCDTPNSLISSNNLTEEAQEHNTQYQHNSTESNVLEISSGMDDVPSDETAMDVTEQIYQANETTLTKSRSIDTTYAPRSLRVTNNSMDNNSSESGTSPAPSILMDQKNLISESPNTDSSLPATISEMFTATTTTKVPKEDSTIEETHTTLPQNSNVINTTTGTIEQTTINTLNKSVKPIETTSETEDITTITSFLETDANLNSDPIEHKSSPPSTDISSRSENSTSLKLPSVEIQSPTWVSSTISKAEENNQESTPLPVVENGNSSDLSAEANSTLSSVLLPDTSTTNSSDHKTRESTVWSLDIPPSISDNSSTAPILSSSDNSTMTYPKSNTTTSTVNLLTTTTASGNDITTSESVPDILTMTSPAYDSRKSIASSTEMPIATTTDNSAIPPTSSPNTSILTHPQNNDTSTRNSADIPIGTFLENNITTITANFPITPTVTSPRNDTTTFDSSPDVSTDTSRKNNYFPITMTTLNDVTSTVSLSDTSILSSQENNDTTLTPPENIDTTSTLNSDILTKTSLQNTTTSTSSSSDIPTISRGDNTTTQSESSFGNFTTFSSLRTSVSVEKVQTTTTAPSDTNRSQQMNLGESNATESNITYTTDLDFTTEYPKYFCRRMPHENLTDEETLGLMTAIFVKPLKEYSREWMNKETVLFHYWLVHTVMHSIYNMSTNKLELESLEQMQRVIMKFVSLIEVVFVYPTPLETADELIFTFFILSNGTINADVILPVLQFKTEIALELMNLPSVYFIHGDLMDSTEPNTVLVTDVLRDNRVAIIAASSIVLFSVAVLFLAAIFTRRRSRASVHCITDRDQLQEDMNIAVESGDLNSAVTILQDEIQEKSEIKNGKFFEVGDDEVWVVPISQLPLQEQSAPEIQDTKL